MKSKWGIALITGWLAAVSAQPTGGRKNSLPIKPEVISYCMLLDQNAPVEEKVANYVERVAIFQVEQHTGFRFLKVEERNYNGSYSLSDIANQRPYCHNADFVMLQTNHVAPNPEELGVANSEDDINSLIVFQVGSRMDKKIYPALVLEHEIGHLFGADDEADPKSLMSHDSDGKDWTPQILAMINNYRLKRWHRQ